MTLKDKVAVVLGASSGIGEGISRALAEQGLKGLVLAARRKDKLEALAASLQADHKVDTLVVPTDATSPEGLQYLIGQTLAVENNESMLLPILKFSYYKLLTDKKNEYLTLIIWR